MKLKKLSGVVIAFVTLTSASYAATPGAYWGAGVGYSKLDNFSDATATTNGGVGGMLLAGYNFNKFFGLEAGYRMNAKTTYKFDENNDSTFSYNSNAFTLAAKGYLPLDNSPFDLYGLVGVARVHGEGGIELPNGQAISPTDAILALAGVGINYQLNSKITFGLEYSRTGSKNGSGDHIGIPASNLTALTMNYHLG